MDIKLKNTAFFLTVLSVILFTSATGFAASAIKVPAKVVSPRTSMVIYFNIDALKLDKIKESAHVFANAIPDSDKNLRQKLNKTIESKMSKASDKVQAALSLQKHIHKAVISIIPAAKDESKDGDDTQSSKAHKGVKSLVLLQGDSSTTAKSLSEAFKKASALADTHKSKNDIPKVSRIDGNWFLIQELDHSGKVKKSSIVPKDVGDLEATKKFNTVLNSSKKSAIRFAIVSNKQMKDSMSQSAQDGGPQAMLANSFKPMQTALVTLKFGAKPALDIKINFDNNKDAKAANDAVSNLLSMFKSMVQMQLPSLQKKMDNPPSSDLINTLFKELSPAVKGNAITIGLHKKFVQNLAKLAPAVDKIAGPMIKNKLKEHGEKAGI